MIDARHANGTYVYDPARLYRAARFPDRWEPVADLIEGHHADPSVFRARNAWWMFSCTPPGENETLRLFRSDSLTGRWSEHPRSPVVAGDPHIARPAGRVVSWGGRPIRFAQDCRPRYGLQVRAFRITGPDGRCRPRYCALCQCGPVSGGAAISSFRRPSSARMKMGKTR